MFEYVVNYFWLERKWDSLIGRISDRLSEGTGSIPVLVLWSFLISRSCSLRHIHVDTFPLLCIDCPWTHEMITNVGFPLTCISNSLTPLTLTHPHTHTPTLYCQIHPHSHPFSFYYCFRWIIFRWILVTHKDDNTMTYEHIPLYYVMLIIYCNHFVHLLTMMMQWETKLEFSHSSLIPAASSRQVESDVVFPF